MEHCLQHWEQRGFVNFFGIQRFGVNAAAPTHEVRSDLETAIVGRLSLALGHWPAYHVVFRLHSNNDLTLVQVGKALVMGKYRHAIGLIIVGTGGSAFFNDLARRRRHRKTPLSKLQETLVASGWWEHINETQSMDGVPESVCQDALFQVPNVLPSYQFGWGICLS